MGRTVDECREMVMHGDGWDLAEIAFAMGCADREAAKPIITQRVEPGVTRIVSIDEGGDDAEV